MFARFVLTGVLNRSLHRGNRRLVQNIIDLFNGVLANPLVRQISLEELYCSNEIS